MTLRLKDKWIWDFWFAREGDHYHIFYLQAERALSDERLRHWHVSIGHAFSDDLHSWEVLPDALHPSETTESAETGEAFDSYTTWTGSIIHHDSLWYMFYTGGKRSEKGLIQRIGLATSPDLNRWTKHPDNPLIAADPRWYEMLDLNLWHDHAWRDPFVFRHPEHGDFHAFITARANKGAADARGVIAHARSSDLIAWEVLPPITQPGEFGHMEVPQLSAINGRYYLLFCVTHEQYSSARKARFSANLQTGTHYLVADNLLGPYRYLTDQFLAGDAQGSLYSGKLIQDKTGTWNFIAARHFGANGEFIGDIIDPMPITILPDGRLQLTDR